MRPRNPMLSIQKSGVPLARAKTLCKIRIIITNSNRNLVLINPETRL